MHEQSRELTALILKARDRARREIGDVREPEYASAVRWPVSCTVGPGLEGAIACESKVGYVNGARGWLIYRGYDVFDLCAHSTYEEVSYLLLYGRLPTAGELSAYTRKLVRYRYLTGTLRILMGFPVEKMNAMGALRLGTNMMRQEFAHLDDDDHRSSPEDAISADEDSIPMESPPRGEPHAIYEFKGSGDTRKGGLDEGGFGHDVCCHLIAGLPTITAAIARVHEGRMPIEPDPGLGHAANLLYMMTGRVPTPEEERIMDIALILHADHGMNASTFAAMVVASTLSDIYFSVGSGIAALNGPLHGGANEQVIRMLEEIGAVAHVKRWMRNAVAEKRKVSGFGHRVYKTHDPRARVLGPLAKHLIASHPNVSPYYRIAAALEKEVAATIGREKPLFPNVDFYSGIVYRCLGIPTRMFTPIFAVARVAGWTARIQEYLQHNRIFRPRAIYTGEFDREYVPVDRR